MHIANHAAARNRNHTQEPPTFTMAESVRLAAAFDQEFISVYEPVLVRGVAVPAVLKRTLDVTITRSL